MARIYPKFKTSITGKTGILDYKDFMPALTSIVDTIMEEASRTFKANAQLRILDRLKIATGKLLNSIDYNVEWHGRGVTVRLDEGKLVDYKREVDRGRKPTKVPVNEIRDWIRDKRSFSKTATTILGNIYKWQNYFPEARARLGVRKDIMAFYQASKSGQARRMSDTGAAEMIAKGILHKGTKSSKFRLMGQTRGLDSAMKPRYLTYPKYLFTTIHETNKKWLLDKIEKAKITIRERRGDIEALVDDVGLDRLWKDFQDSFYLVWDEWLARLSLSAKNAFTGREGKRKKPDYATVSQDKRIGKGRLRKTGIIYDSDTGENIEKVYSWIAKYFRDELKAGNEKWYTQEYTIKDRTDTLVRALRNQLIEQTGISVVPEKIIREAVLSMSNIKTTELKQLFEDKRLDRIFSEKMTKARMIKILEDSIGVKGLEALMREKGIDRYRLNELLDERTKNGLFTINFEKIEVILNYVGKQSEQIYKNLMQRIYKQLKKFYRTSGKTL